MRTGPGRSSSRSSVRFCVGCINSRTVCPNKYGIWAMTSRSSLLISRRVCTLSRVYFIKTHLTQKKKHGTPKKAYFWIIRKIGNIFEFKALY